MRQLQPQPRRQPMKICGTCSTANEPSRTICIGCGAHI